MNLLGVTLRNSKGAIVSRLCSYTVSSFPGRLAYFPLARNASLMSNDCEDPIEQSNDDHPEKHLVDLEDVGGGGLSASLKQRLKSVGVPSLFPVQAATFETVMEGKDLICRSKTGSGKTLAFALPVVQAISEGKGSSGGRKLPQALVLAPTRELAKQVQLEFERVAPKISSTCIYGGVSIGKQVGELRRGTDVVVGTPGRVIDLLNQGALNISEVRFAILDEADHMLQVGFKEDVEQIYTHLPEERQNLLWSATLPPWVHSITKRFMNDPKFVDLVGDDSSRLPKTISHLAVLSANHARTSSLAAVLTVHGQGKRTLVFTQTKKEASDLAASKFLTPVGARALHGDMSQQHREDTLRAFREGKAHVLVATDVAARGLDIPNVELVVHYRLPDHDEYYVHRCGRTGRAGNEGTSIAICQPEDLHRMRELERQQGFECLKVPPPGPELLCESLAVAVSDRLNSSISPQMRQLFEPTARRVLEEDGDGGVQKLSAAMALLAGWDDHPPESMSCLDGREGYRTIALRSPNRKAFHTRGLVMGFLDLIDPKLAEAARNPRAGRNGSQGYVDLPPAKARDLLERLQNEAPPHQSPYQEVKAEPVTELNDDLLDGILQKGYYGGYRGRDHRGRGRSGRDRDFGGRRRGGDWGRQRDYGGGRGRGRQNYDRRGDYFSWDRDQEDRQFRGRDSSQGDFGGSRQRRGRQNQVHDGMDDWLMNFDDNMDVSPKKTFNKRDLGSRKGRRGGW